MTDPHDKLVGQRVGAVLLHLDTDEKSFVSGVLTLSEGVYSIQGDNFNLPLPEDFPIRLRRVEPSPDTFAGVEYLIFLSVGQMPDDAEPSEFRNTGLKWPGPPDS